MKVVIPGGSGQVGTVLARAFHAAGDEVVVLSRRREPRPWQVAAWDGATAGAWHQHVDGCDAVINLAGRSVNCRYHAANRREILDSRVSSTRAVGRAIAGAAHPPRVWLQASTATIYAYRFDAPNDEYSGSLGGSESSAPEAWRFSIDVARAWESACDEFGAGPTRKVMMRSAITLSPDRGGAFDTLLALVRYGLGGPAGDGRQYISWVHDKDFIAAVRWLIDREDLDGVVNIASPYPVPHADFMRVLRRMGDAGGIGGGAVDDRDRRFLPAHGERAPVEEPSCRSQTPARERVRVPLLVVGRRGKRPVPRVEGAQGTPLSRLLAGRAA
jgi:uncharacterized protein (TIGR01777 family)